MPVDAIRRKRSHYSAKAGSRIPPRKAQAYGEFLERLARHYGGRLEAEAVVNAARNHRSPLHGYFEWNNSIAAEEYRKVQARELIRAIVILEERTGIEVRAFENVFLPPESGGGCAKSYYVPIEDILSSNGLTEQLLEDAINYLRWFRRKFENLSQLKGVHQAIDRTLAKLGHVSDQARK